MKIKFSNIVFILISIIVLFLVRITFKEYNTNKAISACIMAQKQKSNSFDLKKSKDFCEKEIKN